MTGGEPIDRRGWTLVWVLAAGQLISWGSLYYSFSLFLAPMQQELGWSKPALSGALSLGLLVSGAAAVPIGAWMDRHGGRLVMTAGSIAAGLLLVAWSQVTSIVWFYALWAALGVVHAATLYTPAFTVLTGNLGGSFRRGITWVTVVGGLASTVFIPLTQWLIQGLGWRHALLALALGNLPLCAVLHGWVLRGTAPSAAARRSSAAGKSPLRAAMATGTFWGIMAAYVGFSATFSALTVHFVPLLTERGLPMASILAGLALIGPMQVAGRLALLAVGPRLDGRQIGFLSMACQPVGVALLLLLPPALWSLALFALIYGAGNGMHMVARGVIVPELIGKEGYATINAALGLPSTLAYALAPAAAALLWQAHDNYDALLWTLLGLATAAAGLFGWVVRQRSPARVPERGEERRAA